MSMIQVESHFLDSGAFSLRPKAEAYAKTSGDRWGYFDTPEFFGYMKQYVRFVKKYQIAIDLYANVDAIGNAELTWRNQKWLEKRGLHPVPVVHYGTDPDLKWLKHYISHGYDLIGIGALVGKLKVGPALLYWLDKCFDYICDNSTRTPSVKLHGFGVTSFLLMTRYPWWSTDSTTWLKVAGFGGIIVPRKRKGKFIFNENPYLIAISTKSSKLMKEGGQHYLTLNKAEQAIVQEWLDSIQVPLGQVGIDDSGVINNRYARVKANLLFFEHLCASLPAWPWPFPRLKKRAKLL